MGKKLILYILVLSVVAGLVKFFKPAIFELITDSKYFSKSIHKLKDLVPDQKAKNSNTSGPAVVFLKNGRIVEAVKIHENNGTVYCETTKTEYAFKKEDISQIAKGSFKITSKTNQKHVINSIKSSPVSHSFSVTNDARCISQREVFVFDGFKWQILNVYRMYQLGSSNNLQYPQNDEFIVVEASLKNISQEPRYYGDFTLLSGENQYEDSSTVTVYGRYFFNYASKDSIEFEPGSNLKTYFGFDVKKSNSFTLLIKSWGLGNKRVRIKIDQMKTVESRDSISPEIYKFSSFIVNQKDNYLYVSGRVSGGIHCDRLLIDVYLVNEKGFKERIECIANDVGGSGSRILTGKERVHVKGRHWQVLETGSRCQ